MNEHELKGALRDAVVASSPPPPMDVAAALERGRRADRRRRATWGAGVAGLAVVGIAVGAALVPTAGGGAGPGVGAGPSNPAPPSVTLTGAPPPSAPSAPSSASSSTSETKPSWPDGQTDRTATSGPHADRATKLLADVGAALPAGLRAEDRERVGYPDHGPMTRVQGQYADTVDGVQVWEYTAITPLVRLGEPGVAKLRVEVETKGNNTIRGEACEAATQEPYPISGGTCEVVEVDGRRVGVVTGAGADRQRDTYDSAAFYRHPDGTLVKVGVSRAFGNSGLPGMAEVPLSARQLAALAADQRFHLE
ncbi:hypothetical protein [Saccharothrix syringae]|uniref:Uncharacterized protein n=1 Tax=Saccharothrix syringae TaxID=103733 RepID=A0A5Q0H934_SACSY|nr:hypothetical protein [Saccharothrix syringae]QFZ22464.1 hypothetical protein EKG83_38105 [Saccharothrix syringae]